MQETTLEKIDSELKNGRALLMIYWEKCKFCKELKPKLEELEKKMPDVQFLTLKDEGKVPKVPLLIFINDKKPYFVSGNSPIEEITKNLALEPKDSVENVITVMNKLYSERDKLVQKKTLEPLKAKLFDINVAIERIQYEAQQKIQPLLAIKESLMQQLEKNTNGQN